MRNDLEYYRKFSIKEYLVNAKKFRDYCDFCKRTENNNEKIKILETLVSYTNNASVIQVENKKDILENLISMCVNTIINTDFEVECFLNVPNFTVNFQKEILINCINVCFERNKEMFEISKLKYYLWIFKYCNTQIQQNKNFELLLGELLNAIETVEKFIQFYLDTNELSKKQLSFKVNLLKAAYELGIYWIYHNNIFKASRFFSFIIKNFVDSPGIYFTLESIKHYLIYIQKKSKVLKQSATKNTIKKNEEKGTIFKNLKEKILENKDKSKLPKFSHNEIMNQISELNVFYNAVMIDEKSQIIMERLKINELCLGELISSTNLLNFNKGLIYNSLDNSSKVNVLDNFISKLMTTNNDKTQKLEKEISTISLIQYMINSNFSTNNDERLKTILKELSNIIVYYHHTMDKEIFLLVQILLFNYINNIEQVNKYYNDYITFISKNLENKEENYSEFLLIKEFTNYIINYKMKREITIPNEKFLIYLDNIIAQQNWYFLYSMAKCFKYFDIFILCQICLINYAYYFSNAYMERFSLKCLSNLILKYKNFLSNSNKDLFKIEINFKNKPNVLLSSHLNNVNDIFLILTNLVKLILLFEDNIEKYIFVNESIMIQNNPTTNSNMIKRKMFLNDLLNQIIIFKAEMTKGLPFVFGNNLIKCSSSIEDYCISLCKSHLRINYNERKNSFITDDYFFTYPTKLNFKMFNSHLKSDESISYLVKKLITKGNLIDALFLLQYIYKSQNNSFNHIFKQIKKITLINSLDINLIKNYFDISVIEIFECMIQKSNDYENKVKIVEINKRISCYQYFKNHPYKNLFKILNFYKYLGEQ